jgi:glycosyltransferase involved in cell wall biosynthesis
MKILYLSQYFPPEVGATQNRAYEMAKNLIHLGHEVIVMTEVPNHPSGIIPAKYRNRFCILDKYDEIPVIRNWVWVKPHKTFYSRMLFYLSFMFSTVLNSFSLERKKFDIIYATSPPLFVGIAGLVIAKLMKLPLIFEVRDLWPESAIDLKQISSPITVKMSHWLANTIYSHSKAIIAVTNGIATKLKIKNIDAKKISTIKNGTNINSNINLYDSMLEERLGWKDKFIVLYAGIHGIAQGLETIIYAADCLKEIDNIKFVFIGEGPNKNNLKAIVKKKKLENIEFLPEVPREEIFKYISLSTVCLVPLKKLTIFQGALPSKMFDAWACKKPIILSVNGEAKRELKKANGGIYAEPENHMAIAISVLKLFKNPDLCNILGENGYRFLYKYGYTRSQQAAYLERALYRSIK